MSKLTPENRTKMRCEIIEYYARHAAAWHLSKVQAISYTRHYTGCTEYMRPRPKTFTTEMRAPRLSMQSAERSGNNDRSFSRLSARRRYVLTLRTQCAVVTSVANL